jgi:hypothetical protein
MLLSTNLIFNSDHEIIFNECKSNGFVNESICNIKFGWNSDRFRSNVAPLIKEGIAWIDIFEGININIYLHFFNY